MSFDDSTFQQTVKFLQQKLPETFKTSEKFKNVNFFGFQTTTWLASEKRPKLSNYVLVGYTNGFHIYNLLLKDESMELVSRTDDSVHLLHLIPYSVNFLICIVFRATPSVVRIQNLNFETTHFVRLTQTLYEIKSTYDFLCFGTVGTRGGSVEVYDCRKFEFLISCGTSCRLSNSSPIFTLSSRLVAYSPPTNESSSFETTSVLDEIKLRSQTALDNFLLPSQSDSKDLVLDKEIEMGSSRRELSTGTIIEIRDLHENRVVGRISPKRQQTIERIHFDDSGLLIFICTNMGHEIECYRSFPNSDSEELEYLLRYEQFLSLSRGITPAVICDICTSCDTRWVAVSSEKGTTHVFHLPDSLATGSRSASVETVFAYARIKLAVSVLFKDDLQPLACFGMTNESGTPDPHAQNLVVLSRRGYLISHDITDDDFVSTSVGRPRNSSGIESKSQQQIEVEYLNLREGRERVSSPVLSPRQSPVKSRFSFVRNLEKETRCLFRPETKYVEKLPREERQSPKPRKTRAYSPSQETSNLLAQVESSTNSSLSPVWDLKQAKFFWLDEEIQNGEIRSGSVGPKDGVVMMRRDSTIETQRREGLESAIHESLERSLFEKKDEVVLDLEAEYTLIG